MSRTTGDVTSVPGRFYESNAEIVNGQSHDFDPSDTKTGAVEIHNIIHGDDCDVAILVDPDNDGTYERNVTLDSFTGAGISQGNQIELSDDDNMVLRISNTGTAAADFIVTGRQVSQ